MSVPRVPDPVKLVASIFSADQDIIVNVIMQLAVNFGNPDFISEYLEFDYTDYYTGEMGKNLVRRFLSFEALFSPDTLPEVKRITNVIEEGYSRAGNRLVNIDPGYIAPGHLILATGKPYSHRPYLGKGIYADITLIFENKTFRPVEWTYPDYSDKDMILLLNIIRKKYLVQTSLIKQKGIDHNDE